jgi:hypothetical protein
MVTIYRSAAGIAKRKASAKAYQATAEYKEKRKLYLSKPEVQSKHAGYSKKWRAKSWTDAEYRCRHLLRMCKYRLKKDPPPDLTLEYLMSLYDKGCAITGLPFSLEPPPLGMRCNPRSASLDQIVPKGGYHAANVQLVCSYINIAKNDMSLDLFVQMCHDVVKFQDSNASTV